MGTQRCPMATYRTNLAALRWPGPALAGDASGTQRDFMDLRHRGAVARTAQEISAVPDLPSPFPALGAGGQTGTHLARQELQARGRLQLEEAFIDASFTGRR